MTAIESQSVGPPKLEEAARKAAVDAEAKMQVAQAAYELRDTWVPKLVDAGYNYTQVAKILMISRARVFQILARTG